MTLTGTGPTYRYHGTSSGGTAGYYQYTFHGPGHVGDTIRRLRPTLQGGRPLTANQKERWQRLLRHNRHDCAGMREVCLRAANEMEGGLSLQRG